MHVSVVHTKREREKERERERERKHNLGVLKIEHLPVANPNDKLPNPNLRRCTFHVDGLESKVGSA